VCAFACNKLPLPRFVWFDTIACLFVCLFAPFSMVVLTSAICVLCLPCCCLHLFPKALAMSVSLSTFFFSSLSPPPPWFPLLLVSPVPVAPRARAYTTSTELAICTERREKRGDGGAGEQKEAEADKETNKSDRWSDRWRCKSAFYLRAFLPRPLSFARINSSITLIFCSARAMETRSCDRSSSLSVVSNECIVR